MTSSYRNISLAAAASFRDILTFGNTLAVRGSKTKELVNQITVIERPDERFLFLPDRLNDCFAQIAESFWVLAGRSDIGWLTHYLRRAPDFSDDGEKWRAGYGPRLRDWRGVDQLDEVRKLLDADRLSRRAVMALYDPQEDFVDSKDIPCNNLLSWLVREGKLFLNVAVRSNDAMWGFSGANAFEWSVLHELMAHWLGVHVGPVTFFAGSFHLYENHWDRAERISINFRGRTPYDHGVPKLPIAIGWDDLDRNLKLWFRLEETVRNRPMDEIKGLHELDDVFLRASLEAFRLYWLDKMPVNEVKDEVFSDALAAMPECDLTAAALEFLGRRRPNLFNHITHPNIAAYFEAAAKGPINPIQPAIKKLHTKKDRAYGGAWKKRGELVSILANVARKVDRLEVYRSSRHELVDETVLDTAVDLFVYAGKYMLFLEEAAEGGLLDEAAPRPFSDHDENFDSIVDQFFKDSITSAVDADTLMVEIAATFESLWPLAANAGTIEQKKTLARQITEASARLVDTLQRNHPTQTAAFIRAAGA